MATKRIHENSRVGQIQKHCKLSSAQAAAINDERFSLGKVNLASVSAMHGLYATAEAVRLMKEECDRHGIPMPPQWQTFSDFLHTQPPIPQWASALNTGAQATNDFAADDASNNDVTSDEPEIVEFMFYAKKKSFCPICVNKPINKGDPIAKTNRGRWTHPECVAGESTEP